MNIRVVDQHITPDQKNQHITCIWEKTDRKKNLLSYVYTEKYLVRTLRWGVLYMKLMEVLKESMKSESLGVLNIYF